jgi:tetratricopeptide (TPR) repeat protein
MLDALLSGGLIQAAAEVAVFVLFVVTGLRRIGILASTVSGTLFAAALTLGAVAGALGPFLLTGTWHLSTVGGALGLVLGVLAYVVGAALRPARPMALPAADALLVAALCAAGCAHFAEIQVGLATTTPRLYFVLTTALLVCMTSGARREPSAVARPRRDAVIVGIVTGLLLVTIQFDLRTSAVNLAVHGTTLASGLLLVWLAGAGVLAGDAGGTRPSGGRGAIATCAAISASVWLLFALVHGRWVAWMPPSGLGVETSVRLFGAHLGQLVTLYYSAAGLGLVGLAGVLAYPGVRGLPFRVRAGTPLMAGALLGASLVPVAWNLHAVHADCLTKLGKSYEARGRWPEAVTAHTGAVEAVPTREEYAVNLSRVLIERARRTSDAAGRDADAARAVALAEATAGAFPLNPDHPANLARIERKWARIGEPSARGPHLQRAASAYTQALALAPTNPALWSEVGLFELERGNPAAAQQRFTRAIELAPSSATTYAFRAQCALAVGDDAAARADLRRARELVASRPHAQQELARLYQRAGQLDRALAEARAAAAAMDATAAPAAEAFIAALEAERSAQPAPH